MHHVKHSSHEYNLGDYDDAQLSYKHNFNIIFIQLKRRKPSEYN